MAFDTIWKTNQSAIASINRLDMAEETTPNPESQESEVKAPKAKPAATAAKPKKEKAPAVEDKPFGEFIQQDFTPVLQKALTNQGIENITLTFVKDTLPLQGANPSEECWQLIGNWQNGQRQFNLYFLEENISGKKAFSYSTNGVKPSTIESFMIDERKVTLDLMVLYTLQRLNGQKWLIGN
jgi:hypothetical protein